jgi:hypothetical protein
MLFGETVAVYCENRTEHINTLCGQNVEFSHIKTCGIYSYHCSLYSSNNYRKHCWHQGMARPRVADGRDGIQLEVSCEYIE